MVIYSSSDSSIYRCWRLITAFLTSLILLLSYVQTIWRIALVPDLAAFTLIKARIA